MSILSPRILTLIIVFAFVLALVAIRSCVVLKHKRAAMDLIRHAIDRGQMLEPAAIQALLGSPIPNPQLVLFSGIVATAGGIGLSLISIRLAALLAGAGIGLIVASRFLDAKPASPSVPM
jgi:hypothetical protein